MVDHRPDPEGVGGGHRAAAHLRVRLGRAGGGRRADRPAPLARALGHGRHLARGRHDARARSRPRCGSMFAQRHKEERAYVPARVMNMVVIVDKDFRGEVENRLQRVGRYHPSRLIVVRGRAGPAAALGGRAHRHRRRRRARARSRSGASASSCWSASATCPSSTRSSTRWSSATWRRWCGRRTATPPGSTRCGGSRRSC